MPKLPARTLLTLLIDDQGAALYRESGQLLAILPHPEPEVPLRTLWTPVLMELAEPGAQIQFILDNAGQLVQCQDVPFLSPREQRDVAGRLFAAEMGVGELMTAAALDPDPLADGGQTLWLAGQPRSELEPWLEAIQGAGWLPVFATPLTRALLQGLDGLRPSPPEAIVLAAGPGAVGHLCYFHGRALALQRSFNLPSDPESAEEVVYEEVSRLLQFIKQKNRDLVFPAIEVVGLPDLSAAFRSRLNNALRLDLVPLAPALWPVLLEGLVRERGHRAGLNLLPREIQEATRLRVFKGTVWAAGIVLGLLFVAGTLFLYGQELLLDREVDRAEQLLASREARVPGDERIVQVRVPLLRIKLAEQHQAKAVATLASLGCALFRAPHGIQLEKVEILESPGVVTRHRFTVTGLAFTDSGFSMGPLAQYMAGLAQAGVVLAPGTEASTSDRVVDSRDKHLDQLAITRFTLRGTGK